MALFAIGAAAVTGIGADHAMITGNGIVAGDLTAVAPIVEARLKRVFVHCLDHVQNGQRLAEFENEATVETAAQQLLQLQLQLTQARAEIAIADREAAAAQKMIDAQKALRDQLSAVLQAQDELVKKEYVAGLVWQQAKANLARAEAETSAAEFVYETKRADQKKAELDAEVLQSRIDSFRNSPELTGHFFLTAPKSGIVTECVALPGEVVAAKSPIFKLFNPDDAYAIVFLDPDDSRKVAIGQQFSIRVGGIDKSVSGRVSGFYPELSALPSSLTRYFWQEERWSQYAPVRLDFIGLTAAQKSRLLAWAHLSASRWQMTRLPQMTGALLSSGPVQWVQRQFGGAWQFVATAFAQPAGHR